MPLVQVHGHSRNEAIQRKPGSLVGASAVCLKWNCLAMLTAGTLMDQPTGLGRSLLRLSVYLHQGCLVYVQLVLSCCCGCCCGGLAAACGSSVVEGDGAISLRSCSVLGTVDLRPMNVPQFWSPCLRLQTAWSYGLISRLALVRILHSLNVFSWFGVGEVGGGWGSV